MLREWTYQSLVFGILVLGAIGCGSDEMAGRYEGVQTVETLSGETYTAPLILDISESDDGETVLGQWIGEQGIEQGQITGSWDEDRSNIFKATASISILELPVASTPARKAAAERQKSSRPAPEDETETTGSESVGVTSAQPTQTPSRRNQKSTVGSQDRTSSEQEACAAVFSGALKYDEDKQTISGLVRYDASNPFCPTDITSRYIDLKKIVDEDD